MNYSPSIDVIMSLALNEALSADFGEIQPEHICMALLKFSELDPDLLDRALPVGEPRDQVKAEVTDLKSRLDADRIDSTNLRRRLRTELGRGSAPASGAVLHRSARAKAVFARAQEWAAREGTDLLGPAHLLTALMDQPSPPLARLLNDQRAQAEQVQPDALQPPEAQVPPESETDLASLTATLKNLRRRLLDQVFGQDQAVHTMIEGLFAAELLAAADLDRRGPRAVFLLAGPPGVGKTWLAESCAQALGRPFRRFDMSGYSDEMGVVLLAGAQRSYKDAGPGQLTGFVAEHPRGVLLFDEIEKAGPAVIHLFLQILDQGRLEDKFNQETVTFRDTIIIFTTNAGRSLYEDPNGAGIHATRADFHRRTILSALEQETDPRSGRHFFPQAIVSRLATGYPIMFNRLGLGDMERITARELTRVGDLLRSQYGFKVRIGPIVPLCLVMREGPYTDARTAKAQAAGFLKAEMFKLFSLYEPERLEMARARAGRILLDLDTQTQPTPEVSPWLEPPGRARLLIVARPEIAAVWPREVSTIEATIVLEPAGARDALAAREYDLVLLDLWLGENDSRQNTAWLFDHVPLAAQRLKAGQELLRHLRESHPEIPCLLLNLVEADGANGLDEELYFAAVRAGGARGAFDVSRAELENHDPAALEPLTIRLATLSRNMVRERRAGEQSARGQALAFDTAPTVSPETGDIFIRLRNLRLTEAAAADDLGDLLGGAIRPTTQFADVYGADQAKAELAGVVEWLREPRRYQDLGLRPPRGLLLHGPPGTGKTMLARALAGECRAAFLVESATNFVTKWVGSGPENVRRLFARARRYAPSIVFIDEIDAIGRRRSADGHHRAHEETLNTLLIEMDGFRGHPTRPVLVLAATNLAGSLDEALRRRFDREIEVDRPDRAARLAYLQMRLSGTGRQITAQVIDRLAGQSAGMTVAELERVVQLAGRRGAISGRIVDDALIEEAFETMRMGDTRGPADRETLLRVARHEAGHCLIGWLRGDIPLQVTIVARGRAGGFVERETREGQMLLSRVELEGLIRQSLGGRAAEILYYGATEGPSSGASGDIQQATDHARRMVRDYGMDESIGPVALDPERITDGPLALRLHDAIRNIVASQLDRALEELATRRPALDRLVAALMDRNRLTRSDLDALLEGVI